MYKPFLDCTTLGLNGVLLENNTLCALCLGCSIVKDKIFRFIMRIITQETYLCQLLLVVSGFKHPNTMTGIVPKGGGNSTVVANHGLIPASLQRLIVVAIHSQHDSTLPEQIIASDIIQPSNPITTIVKGKLSKNTIKATELVIPSNAQLIRYTPQYSLREALPVKAKYFLYCSSLFITLSSLLILHYQLLQVASS